MLQCGEVARQVLGVLLDLVLARTAFEALDLRSGMEFEGDEERLGW